MIEFLNGRLVEKHPTHAVIECAGIGYWVHISQYTYDKLGNDEGIRILTHLAIREDAHTLYGFIDELERKLFRQLISVSGVGASTAMAILSALSPADIHRAILDNDVNLLKAVKGIGAKSAQRIIVDLRDKLQKETPLLDISPASNNTKKNEALSALLALGFDRSSSGKILDKILTQEDENAFSVEQLIKEALKYL